MARCSGEVPMKVWMRGRFAWRTASQQRSMSLKLARASPQIVAVFAPVSRCRAPPRSRPRGDGEARLDDVDAHLVEQRRDLQLFGMGHGGAGGLFAVAQGRVEDQDAVLLGLVVMGLVSLVVLS
jgi:hypothetical protein